MNKTKEHPTVFISYSWDNENHQNWVLNLAKKLRMDGVNVILDKYYLSPGKNLSVFVEESIRTSNRILVILTPEYKLRAEKRIGGVGYEFSIINNELISNISENERVIPIIKQGNPDESIPEFLKQYMYLNFLNDNLFDSNYETLLRELHKQPKILIPKLGIIPQFDKEKKRTKVEPDKKNRMDNIKTVQNSPIESIRDLISCGKIHQALDELADYSKKIAPDTINNIILLKSRLARLDQDKINGIISLDNATLITNQINLAILNFLEEIN